MTHPTPPSALGRNDPCHCGSGKKYKKCHWEADQQHQPEGSPSMMPWLAPKTQAMIKTPRQIEGIRRASLLTAQILDQLEDKITQGVTTNQIDQWVTQATKEGGGIPAPLNYKGYPKSVCTSINEVICHGIPSDRQLVEGDIVNVDVTSVVDGFFGDASRMYLVGAVSPEARKLVEVTRECLDFGIMAVRPGGFIGDIGHAIQTHAEKNGYSVVRDFVGHGIGENFHEEPQVPHYGQKGTGQPLVPGMVFTIEPMINQGKWQMRVLKDNWTAVTIDGSLSAQFEHTVAVTGTGVEVLTLSPRHGR
ncbi:MAG: methionyl aminopeptidase [Deltaproteobacteria bacterium]|nr:methionyl aminopeptidase [Deltaproteobacteria bacterium]